MATIVFMIWCIGIVLSLCVFFRQPRTIFKQIDEHRFPNYSRYLTPQDHAFIDSHLKLIESHQAVLSKIKRPFIFGPLAQVLLFFVFMAVALMLFILSPKLNEWLTDLTINRSSGPSFLVDPYSSIWTFLIAIMVGSIAWIPIFQILVGKKNAETDRFNLLMPSYETKPGTEEFLDELRDIRTRIANNLKTLIREGNVDSSKNYTLDALLNRLSQHRLKLVKRLGVASLAFMFLVVIMEAFNFVKITSNEIVYSPSFSFKVTTKNFEDVSKANYICVNEDNERRLKLSVELENGFNFSVRKYQIEKMNSVLEAANITLGRIDEADSWCKNLNQVHRIKFNDHTRRAD